MKKDIFLIIVLVVVVFLFIRVLDVNSTKDDEPLVGTSTASEMNNSTTTYMNSGNEGIMAFKSGINGKVMLGPTCPVLQNPPKGNCDEKPYSTLVAVFKANDPVHAYAVGESDNNGYFSFALPPGEYSIGAGETNMPACPHVSVSIGPYSYTTTTISCDSGIR